MGLAKTAEAVVTYSGVSEVIWRTVDRVFARFRRTNFIDFSRGFPQANVIIFPQNNIPPPLLRPSEFVSFKFAQTLQHVRLYAELLWKPPVKTMLLIYSVLKQLN